MASDATSDPPPGTRGPKPTTSRDWLFGYAPRRALLAELFGPGKPTAEILEEGMSATELAAFGGRCRSGAKADIVALRELGLITRRRVGRRERYFPLVDSDLARSLCLVLESLERSGRTG